MSILTLKKDFTQLDKIVELSTIEAHPFDGKKWFVEVVPCPEPACPCQNATLLFRDITVVLLFLFLSCHSNEKETTSDWCDQTIRAQFLDLKEIPTKSNWFKVYEVGEEVYAIAEPYNYEEVISYLIIGKEKALLFDSGMGMESIATLVKELTDLPIMVINSHTHYDHIGGNYEFDNILAMKTDYTLNWAKNGWHHDLVKNEVTSEAICLKRSPNLDTATYHIKPFSITAFIKDGHIIDLGKRTIEVLSVPGHAPDAIALLDKENGYLWTGDTFYEAPIWLFFDGTDLEAYEKSIARLATLSLSLTKVFPAHNTPIAKPERLVQLVEAYEQIVSGTKQPKERDKSGVPVYEEEEKMVYEFENFSFLIRADHLKRKGIINY